MQQYQQLAAEKTALQAQVGQMKKDLDAANAELAAVKKDRDAAKAHVAISPAALSQANLAKQSAEQNLEKSRKQTAESGDPVSGIGDQHAGRRSNENQAREGLGGAQCAFDQCAENNLQMFELTNQVLDRYEHVGRSRAPVRSSPSRRYRARASRTWSMNTANMRRAARAKAASPKP